jgi:hypothetical protein
MPSWDTQKTGFGEALTNCRRDEGVITEITEFTERWPCPFFLYFARQVLFCWLAWWQVGNPSGLPVQISMECTLPYLSTGILNLLQPAQAEVVLGQLSRYLASWGVIPYLHTYVQHEFAHIYSPVVTFYEEMMTFHFKIT